MSRPYTDLIHFRGHIIRRCWNLRQRYEDRTWRKTDYRSLVLGALTLELDNLIIEGLRSYAITSVRCAQATGLKLSCSSGRFLSSAEYSAQFVRVLAPNKYKKMGYPTVATRDDEWAIRDPKDIEQILASILGASPTGLRRAIALNKQVFSETKKLRHFYAHRNEDTIGKTKYAIPIMRSGIIKHPDQYVDTVLPGLTSSKYIDWSTSLIEFFSVA